MSLRTDLAQSEQIDCRVTSKQVNWFLVVGAGLLLQYYPALRHLYSRQLVFGASRFVCSCMNVP